MYSDMDTAEAVGFPIRTPPDQSLFASSPRFNAGYHVLHRLLPPRHPPYALIRLTIKPQTVCYGLIFCPNTAPVSSLCRSCTLCTFPPSFVSRLVLDQNLFAIIVVD